MRSRSRLLFLGFRTGRRRGVPGSRVNDRQIREKSSTQQDRIVEFAAIHQGEIRFEAPAAQTEPEFYGGSRIVVFSASELDRDIPFKRAFHQKGFRIRIAMIERKLEVKT